MKPSRVCHVLVVAFRDVVMERTVMCVLATAIRRVALATQRMSASILLSISMFLESESEPVLYPILNPFATVILDHFSVTIRILL